MVSGFALPVSIGTLVSQCADEIRIARGFGSRRPRLSHASPAAPASSACMGEPWEMKTLGRRAMESKRLFFPDQAFGLHGLLNLRPRRHARDERRHVRPFGQVDV